MFRLPVTRRKFWAEKLRRNRERDANVQQALSDAGWRCLTVWECAIKGPERRDFDALIDEVVGWVSAGRTARELRGEKPPPD